MLGATQKMNATDGRINEQLKRFDDNQFLVDRGWPHSNQFTLPYDSPAGAQKKLIKNIIRYSTLFIRILVALNPEQLADTLDKTEAMLEGALRILYGMNHSKITMFPSRPIVFIWMITFQSSMTSFLIW